MKVTAVERLMAKVAIQPSGCWEWTAHRDREGYGKFWYQGNWTTAHRAAYLLVVGPMEEGNVTDHLCRNHCCVNPSHLEQVTPRENAIRGESPTALNAQKQRCHKGHLLDKKNTYVRPGGGRGCRTCNRAAVRRYKARKLQRQLGVPA